MTTTPEPETPIVLTTEEPQRNRTNTWELYWFHRTDLDASYRADVTTLARAGFVPKAELDAEQERARASEERLQEVMHERDACRRENAKLRGGAPEAAEGEAERKPGPVARSETCNCGRGPGEHEHWCTDYEDKPEEEDPAGGGEEPWTKPVTTAQAKAEFDAALAADEAKRAAGGDEERVTHEEARHIIRWIGADRISNKNWHKLHNYLAQQEQSEREASASLAKISDLSHQLGKAQGEAEGHRLVRVGLDNEVAALKAKFTEANEAWNELHLELQAAESAYDTLRAEVAELKAERDGFRAELSKIRWLVYAWATGHPTKRAGFEADLRRLGCQIRDEGDSNGPTPEQSPTSAQVEPHCHCPKCGALNNIDRNACRNCGVTSLSGVPVCERPIAEPPAVSPGRDRPVMATVAGKLQSAKHYLDMHLAALQTAKLADDNSAAVFWLLRAVVQLADELESKAGK
jgi:hypothetical protein